jgi:hypothetical protein
MKKWLIILTTLGIIFFFSYSILYNGFSDIEKVAVQKYDRDGKEIGKEKIIEGKSTIKSLTRILNRANHERTTKYEMAYHTDYEITIFYKDKSKDVLGVWKKSGPYTQFFRQSNSDWYKIKNDNIRKELIKILN